MLIPRGPPPQTIIQVPSPAVPPPQSQRPPPPAPPGAAQGPGPAGQGIRPPPAAVFAQVQGTLPTTAVIGAAPQLISPATIPPAGMIYAGPPPAYQVPVPQFSAAPPVQAVSTVIAVWQDSELFFHYLCECASAHCCKYVTECLQPLPSTHD